MPRFLVMSDEILVIGGGFAGLAAAVALSEAGRRVRLLEQSQHLGGRARSFRDPVTGSVVDNGQHILMGCYHQTLHFLKTIGTLDHIRFQPRMSVRFLKRGARPSELRLANLPAPWHLMGGVLSSDAFSWREKLQILKLGRALAAGLQKRGAMAEARSSGEMTVESWLSSLGQSERVRRNFWNLLCIAAMNEDPKIASATIFARVLARALFQSPADSRIGIPATGLSDCYTEAAANYIRQRGGRVELGKRVAVVIARREEVEGVGLADGTEIQARTIVSAIPWFRLAQCLPPELASRPFFSGAWRLKPAPIISVCVWFDRSVTSFDFAGLRGTTFQWLFNKSKIWGNPESSAFALSLVLSGAHNHISRSSEDLTAAALRELNEVMPEVRDAKLARSWVIKEPFATFSPVVGVGALRPPCQTPLRGFYLAGDWTSTGLPATIEGAVESGYTAAETILERDAKSLEAK
jgi:squalene-associated FAD-dependent desaturase